MIYEKKFELIQVDRMASKHNIGFRFETGFDNQKVCAIVRKDKKCLKKIPKWTKKAKK